MKGEKIKFTLGLLAFGVFLAIVEISGTIIAGYIIWHFVKKYW